MREINLVNNKGVTMIDDEDYKLLSQYRWRISNGYAVTHMVINKKQVTKRMHRLIMNEPRKFEIDHIDHNKLNNCKSNLRVVTHQQNMINVSNHKNSSSKYKGVGWRKDKNKWESRIKLNENRYFLGYFNSEINTARAYNIKAKELFGEYAHLNKV